MRKFLLLLLISNYIHAQESTKSVIDLKEVFWASPFIYSILIVMSIAALSIWIFSFLSFRSHKILPKKEVDLIRRLVIKGSNDKALELCKESPHFFAKILITGLQAKADGQTLVNIIKSEGKRNSTHFWQRLSLLNDIAIIAPMLGLLGTVIGMFYAFYDVNRSIESLSALFDGLGIAVGTTVVGLIVAIMAMILYTTSKYRLVKMLSLVENEVVSLTQAIEHAPGRRIKA